MDDYEQIIHLENSSNDKNRVWCGKSCYFENMIKTEKEEECNCNTCLKRLKLERDRIKKINKMRIKLGWNPIKSI